MLTLTLLEHTLAIHHLPAQAALPKAALNSPFFAAMRTADELSLVLPESVGIESEKAERDWACFKVNGPLDLSQVGVMAQISTALAQAGVALFALSTFETDYILVKREQVRAAQEALTSAGMKVRKARKKAEPESKSVFTILEQHIPTIRKLLAEKVGAGALSALTSDQALALALGSVYEFLPAGVRIIIRREAFVDFGLKNKKKLLPSAKRTGKK
ncbi:MAG: hypothetical protein Fur0043_27780 [Anaerolineales bacterium]